MDIIQPWRTPFPIWNQSIVPWPVLTVASWPAYRFLNRQVRWSGIPTLSFRIWNSSTGIPSPPLALFVVMLPKAHLTSHSRMSGSVRVWVWVITPSWLSGSWFFFVQFFCVFLPPILNVLLLLGPYHFCPLLSPSLHEMFPWTWNNRLVPNRKRSTSRLYMVTLLI